MSDTRELVWDCATADAATFTVDAPNVKLFTGFPKGRTFDLGDVALKVGETKLGWATVSLVSHDATGFDRPGRILLAATSVAFRPTGLSLKPDQRLSVDFGVSVASDGTVSFEPWGCMATAVNP